MADSQHLDKLKEGVEAWNQWRKQNPDVTPDLSAAELNEAELSLRNLAGANLNRANLSRTNLSRANLADAILRNAKINRADLLNANLSGADLYGATLSNANLSGADLSRARLNHAELYGANLTQANLTDTNFDQAKIGVTVFANLDLSEAKNLETVRGDQEPSTIGIDTLYRSHGKIPESFLRGCGVPNDFIAFIPSHFGAEQAIQFYSCFISYTSKDEEFARRLHSRMRDEGLRVWFAPEDIKGGEKLHEQIQRAIQLHDRLMIVLSDHSMQSEWVVTEIREAREQEIEQKRRKLFPIRLVDFETIRRWKCPDADSGKDLAVEVREYFIPDFSNWKDYDSFEAAFRRLLNDLRAAES